MQDPAYTKRTASARPDGTWQARATTYRTVRMRSRLEALWARYFDEQGWRWEYEPGCFADETGQYLPDFLIGGETSVYVEIKPRFVSEEWLDGVLSRLAIIWSSDPDAHLRLLVGAPLQGFMVWDGANGTWSSPHRPTPAPSTTPSEDICDPCAPEDEAIETELFQIFLLRRHPSACDRPAVVTDVNRLLGAHSSEVRRNAWALLASSFFDAPPGSFGSNRHMAGPLDKRVKGVAAEITDILVAGAER